jgi:Right handed beta helix region
MGNNFTVVQFQRQHFGNQPGSFNDIEPDVPFVGAAKDFPFDCPNVNPDETAFLLFQSRDVNHARNIFQVNGVQVFGGLPVSPSRDTWNGNVLLIERHHRLRETGNVLHVESRNANGGVGGDIDDFIIDNVVIQYKTLEVSHQGIFDVRRYGAKGEGQDNDHDAILAARDALNAAGGGVLFFPRGTFVVRGTIELGADTTVLGLGAASVLLAKPGVACFNMLLVRNSSNVHVRDLVLDGNRTETIPPADTNDENTGCGFLGLPVGEGQTGLSIRNVIVRNHHRSGIRILGPHNSNDLYLLNANEVEVIGCQILDCDSRGIILTRVTRARIAGNVITSCTQAGIQLVVSRAVIDGNAIQKTIQRSNTLGGHGIAAANCFDYVIVNNVVGDNVRWGIVASGGVGLSPDEGYLMSRRYVVANNVCRANGAGGITIDPSTIDPTTGEPTGVIHDSFATVASNVCVANKGHGIHTIHAGYLAVHGNICDANDDAGIAIVSSRYAVVADNVLTANHYGVGFWGNPDDVPDGTPDLGHHLLGGNVFEKNTDGEIRIGEHHPAIRQLHDHWPRGDAGGMNLPVKTTTGEPANLVEGVLYLNTADRKLSVFAGGAWRTLQVTTDTSW